MNTLKANPLFTSLVISARRLDMLPRYVGRYTVVFESMLCQQMRMLSSDYKGGYLLMWELSNGGFYMTPDHKENMKVSAPNGHIVNMSADALGITACLYMYSHLSFHTSGFDQEQFSQLFHDLRDWVLLHPEKEAILAAID
ncbi:antirestriction protein [Aeromonas veronii]|nr:antirestriction protein [Aeromonas veronii]